MPTAKTIPEIYFAALESGDLAAVPYADHARLHAPLGPRGLAEPITGADDIRAFLAGIAPIIERIELLNVFENGEWWAGRARIHLSKPENAKLTVFDIFQVRDGAIEFQENHYDPRPALQG